MTPAFRDTLYLFGVLSLVGFCAGGLRGLAMGFTAALFIWISLLLFLGDD